jgi:hypothetical protein
MRRDLLVALVLAALTLGVYWPVRMHDFILYDDPQFITENHQIQSGLTWSTIRYAFTTPVVGNWHPITTLSHALDCQVFGVRAGAHHLVNAFIHSLNAALLFLLMLQWLRCGQGFSAARPLVASDSAGIGRTSPSDHLNVEQKDQGVAEAPPHGLMEIGKRCDLWVCALVALVFALHPLRVESVAWIAERKDVLSGFFFLSTLFIYGRYAGESGGRQSGPEKRKAEKRESSKGETKMEARRFAFRVRSPFPLFRFPAFRFSGLCFALGLMSKPMVVTLPFVLLLLDFWPLRRFEISDLRSQTSKIRWLLLEKLPFFALAAIDCWITIRVQRHAGAMQMISQVSWFERVANAVTSYLRYLSKFFWPIDLAVVYPHPAKHYFINDQWPLWEIVCAGLVLVLITSLFLVQARRRPYLLVGWLWFLGTLIPVIGLVQAGEQAMADRYSYIPLIGPLASLAFWIREATHRVLTRRWKAGFLLGLGVMVVAVLTGLTRKQLVYWQNTVTLFDHAIAVTADNPSAHFALGSGLEKQGQGGKAMVEYRVTVAIDPHYAKAYYNMGQLLRTDGFWQAAVEAYLTAARENPNDVPTQLNLASALPHVDRARDAIAHFERALELDPNSIEALNNLAWLLATSPEPELRNGPRAVQLAEHACALSRLPSLLGTLAAAYAEAGRFSDATQAAEQASVRATEAGDPGTAARNRELLEFYRAGKAYHESR